jgi:hypothetical protein
MEYASIDVQGGQTDKDRIKALRERAANIGCDAVLVTNTIINGGALKATCIVYTEPPKKDGTRETTEAGPGTKLLARMSRTTGVQS